MDVIYAILDQHVLILSHPCFMLCKIRAATELLRRIYDLFHHLILTTVIEVYC
jgi:hypothetical protein